MILEQGLADWARVVLRRELLRRAWAGVWIDPILPRFTIFTSVVEDVTEQATIIRFSVGVALPLVVQGCLKVEHRAAFRSWWVMMRQPQQLERVLMRWTAMVIGRMVRKVEAWACQSREYLCQQVNASLRLEEVPCA